MVVGVGHLGWQIILNIGPTVSFFLCINDNPTRVYRAWPLVEASSSFLLLDILCSSVVILDLTYVYMKEKFSTSLCP